MAFSRNVVFLDTEFSSLDPYRGEILSIGLITLQGDELYLELDFEGEIDPWQRENVLPMLQGPKITRAEAGDRIRRFVGDGEPYIVSYVGQFDAIYLYKLLGIEGHPFHWLPIDFASMLFGAGRDPEALGETADTLARLGLDPAKYRRHHALDDARMLRDVYLKLVRD